jgi:hypothetical protein
MKFFNKFRYTVLTGKRLSEDEYEKLYPEEFKSHTYEGECKTVQVDIYTKDTPKIVSQKINASLDGKVIFGNTEKFKALK